MFQYPQTANGFIDEEKIFKLVVGTMKLPLAYMEELTPQEFIWLVENHYEEQKDHYDMISNAVMFGYASAKKGKKIAMFDKPQEKKVNKITKEQKEKELNYLDQLFTNKGRSVE